jgi:iron complex outermembrane recepter protein
MRFVAEAARLPATTRLLAGASLAAFALAATPAWAEDAATDAAAAADATPAPAGTAATDKPEIVVTGSRVVTNGMDSPVPVTAVTAENLDKMDPSSLIASVSQLPQFYNNQTPNNANFFTRASTGSLNMRGLGVNRTLTLLDGRRFPSSSAFGGVDINLFPEAFIKSIETVTGGASAQYGTDAVAGVVNFILNTDFTGFQAKLQGGLTSRDDAYNWEGDFAYGTNIGERGHVLIGASRAVQNGVHSYQGRNWYKGEGALLINNVWTDYPGVVSAHGSFDGIITSAVDVDPNTPGVQNPLNGLQFDSNGQTHAFVPGSICTGAVGTSGARCVGGSGDDIGAEVNTIWPDTNRYSIFGYADYDISSNFNVYGQYVRGYNSQFNYNTPRGYFLGNPQGTITIFSGNAYLPANIQQIMTQNKIASFNLRRVGSILDIGQSSLTDTTTQDVGTVGFKSTIGGDGFLQDWHVDGFYQYGHSKRVWDQYAIRLDRIYAALDAVRDSNGNIVCRVSTTAAGAAAFPGCTPLDLFGRGNASPQAVDYVLGNDPGQHVDTPLYFANLGYTGATLSYDAPVPKRNITTFVQHLAEVSARGNLFDGWAGPVQLAVGGSYRHESIYQIVKDTTNPSSNFDTKPYTTVKCDSVALGLRGVPAGDCANNAVGFQFSKVSNIQGASDVYEAFSELYVPLLDTKAVSANADGSVRWANYSGSGNIWAYKGGADIGFFDTVRFRGTYSRDVRAGNLSERFDKTGGVASVDDPRTPNTIETISITTFSGGNPNIKPEKADTYTAGVVVTPQFIPGLSASVDWYRVKIQDAIGRVGVNEVLRRCLVDQDPVFCSLVTLVNDSPTNVGDLYVNINQSKVEGVDAEIDYHTPVKLFGGGMEAISARVLASWLINRSDTSAPTPAAPNGTVTHFDDVVGLSPDNGAPGLYPAFKATGNITYVNGPFSLFVQGRVIGAGMRTRYLSGLLLDDPKQTQSLANNRVPSVFYLDMNVSYDFDIGGAVVEAFATATNLLDKSPPVTGAYLTNLAANPVQANTALYDVLGSRFTFGVKVKM